MAAVKRMIEVNVLEELRYTHIIQFWNGKLTKSVSISKAPAVEAAEVVPCGKCKFYECYGQTDGTHYCGHSRGIVGGVPADGFCYLGERKV